MKSPVQILVAIAVLLATATVAAQVYKWVDKDGQVQYSDRPPTETSKVESKKLGSAAPGAPANASATTAAKSGDVAKSPKDKAKDAAKDAEKRKTEAGDKAKKDDDLARIAKANEERCKGATNNLRDYESGRPINRTADNGERSFLSDEERAAEVARMRAAMTESCK